MDYFRAITQKLIEYSWRWTPLVFVSNVKKKKKKALKYLTSSGATCVNIFSIGATIGDQRLSGFCLKPESHRCGSVSKQVHLGLRQRTGRLQGRRYHEGTVIRPLYRSLTNCLFPCKLRLTHRASLVLAKIHLGLTGENKAINLGLQSCRFDFISN